MSKINPCPKCGSTNCEEQNNLDSDTLSEGWLVALYGLYWIACLDCGHKTSRHDTQEDAIEEWNSD